MLYVIICYVIVLVGSALQQFLNTMMSTCLLLGLMFYDVFDLIQTVVLDVNYV